MKQFNRYVITSQPECYRLDPWKGVHQEMELQVRAGVNCDKYFPHPVLDRFWFSSIYWANSLLDGQDEW